MRTLIFPGNGTDLSHTLTIQAPTLSTSPTITLPGEPLVFPAANGSGVLTNNGSGVLSWMTPASGTVTAVSVATANGFAGSSSGGATPALTVTTSVTGMLKGNGTAISAATSGTDYSAGTSALGTGILKSTTGTGALTIAVATDFPTLNQSTTGSAAKWTTARNLAGNSVDGSADVPFANKFIVQGTTDAGLSGAQFLGSLATGLVKNTTSTGALNIATSGTDYSAGTSALGTGILKSTTGTGALTIAAAADFPTLNQSTTGTANIAGGTIGAIPYQSAANTTTVLAATATANQILLSGASAAPAWSTAAYPAATTINQLLYSSAANTITGLSTANYGLLTTNSSGVPSINTDPVVSGVIQSGVVSANTGGLALANSSSSHLTTIQAGNASAAVTYTLPTADAATIDEALTSDGSGTLSWDTIGISLVSGQSNGSFTDGKFAYPMGLGAAVAALTFGSNEMIVTRPGTIKHLFIQVAAAPTSGKDYEIVIIKNGTPTAVAADVTSGNTTAHDITHTVSFAAGDLISVEMTHVTAAGTAGKAIWAFELVYP